MSAKFKDKYRIESNRWEFWNYSNPGSYFITICTKDSLCTLGHIVDDKMVLSTNGQIVKNEFLEIPNYHHRISLDEWIVMPNHVHCLITLSDALDDVEEIHEFPLRRLGLRQKREQGIPMSDDDIKQYRKLRRKMLIPKIIGKFKMLSSKQMNEIRQTPGIKNWQANYHDNVVRDAASFEHIRNYIINNPSNWKGDRFNVK